MQISTRNFGPSKHQFNTLAQNFRKIRWDNFAKGVLSRLTSFEKMTSCRARLGRKTVSFQGLLEYRFWSQRQTINVKNTKLNTLQNGCLGFLKFLLFEPQSQNFDCPKASECKFKMLKNSKNGIYRIEQCTNNRCTKFQANVFIFDYAMAYKPGKLGAVTFSTKFWAFLIVLSQNKWLLELWDKTGIDSI